MSSCASMSDPLSAISLELGKTIASGPLPPPPSLRGPSSQSTPSLSPHVLIKTLMLPPGEGWGGPAALLIPLRPPTQPPTPLQPPPHLVETHQNSYAQVQIAHILLLYAFTPSWLVIKALLSSVPHKW